MEAPHERYQCPQPQPFSQAIALSEEIASHVAKLSSSSPFSPLITFNLIVMELLPASQAGPNDPEHKLSDRPLALQNCYVTEILAFPRSLAVCRGGILSWNATSWLARFPIGQLVLRKIAYHCNNHMLHEDQICEFKGSTMNDEQFCQCPDIRLLVVFPRMKKSFLNEEVQRIWTDRIVLPSIFRHNSSDVLQYLPPSYRTIRSKSQAMREEFLQDVGDTPCCIRFRSDNLEAMWEDIISTTQQEGFEEFRDAFIVALGQWHPTYSIDTSIDGAWKRVAKQWDFEMDMAFIPQETLEIRVESQLRLDG